MWNETVMVWYGRVFMLWCNFSRTYRQLSSEVMLCEHILFISSTHFARNFQTHLYTKLMMIVFQTYVIDFHWHLFCLRSLFFSLSLFLFGTTASVQQMKKMKKDRWKRKWTNCLFLFFFFFFFIIISSSFLFWRVALSPHHNNHANEYINIWKTCGCITKTTMR